MKHLTSCEKASVTQQAIQHQMNNQRAVVRMQMRAALAAASMHNMDVAQQYLQQMLEEPQLEFAEYYFETATKLMELQLPENVSPCPLIIEFLSCSASVWPPCWNPLHQCILRQRPACQNLLRELTSNAAAHDYLEILAHYGLARLRDVPFVGQGYATCHSMPGAPPLGYKNSIHLFACHVPILHRLPLEQLGSVLGRPFKQCRLWSSMRHWMA